jgi:hemolysin III
MKNIKKIQIYSPTEERINIVTHAFGFIASIFAFVFLVRHAFLNGSIRDIVSFGIFGLSLITLYAASTLYHSAVEEMRRRRLKVFDHSSIFVLIAGSYTPYTLVTLYGKTGWILFGVSWGIALMGITLKLFFTGRFKFLSTLLYVLMGWVIVFAIKPLMHNLPSEGLFWLFLGGVAYTLGAILYGIKAIKFNHAIFHFLVLIGSFCHFISIYFYVLPSR